MLVDGLPAAAVPATDRGLNYGDGLFETLRLHRGRVCLLDRHLHRLRAGCVRLALPYPGDGVLREDIERLAGEQAGDAVLRLVLTRGDGGRGYTPPAQAQGRRIVALHPLPPIGPDALRLGLCTTRLGRNTALAGLKHLNRLEQVLAAAEVAAAGWDEGLMLDETGLVIEATRHNVFFLRAGRICTPPLAHAGVAGVMRQLVIETAAAMGMGGDERPLRYDELHEIDSLFLCNAVAGPRRVTGIGTRSYEQGDALERLRPGLVERGVAWLA
ncbi:aminodeoxychorismate lyase [Wenzhouxiangella sp. XN24]|uniref:aminodeoxychorismate lyase n=1 Tax=Wenzhouxiangella sp. XN24 TaxID=2713569 RepID=UPI001F10F847|nr:aminodeoxychorismate lyase [Wenzhouxiangella sp. XN24]